MTHSFRFSDNLEDIFEENKRIVSVLTDTPEDELTDTYVLYYCLRKFNKDYFNNL